MAKILGIIWHLLLLLPCGSPADEIEVKIPEPQSAEDASHDYYYQLLKLALKNSNNTKYKIQIVDGRSVTQGRSAYLLNGKYLDVYWMGTSLKREALFRAIKIPLLKGLLGYRVSIINKEQKSVFAQIDEDSLRAKVACQGQHWPDTEILKRNGFNVIPVARYELMFDLVDINRCDYFPRAIFEGYSELELASQRLSNIDMYDQTILHYPFPIFFFVHKDAVELAQDIEMGLEQAIDNGQFDKLIQNHPVTKHLFPISKWKDKQVVKLTNPFIDQKLNTSNPRYWLKLAEK